MSDQFNDITKEGYQIIEQEIANLKASRPAKIKALADARALGDLSENAEYSSAKRDLRHLESRLRFLTKQLQYARIYEPSDQDIVEIGKTVTFEFTDTHEIDSYQIVGTPEVDIDHDKISIASPIGKALLGHKTGDTVSVTAPNSEYQITIIKITLNGG
ncbi:transcription elongation factor GreA [Lentilactobacillus sp. SPB1-3]|uniref:Transcription elongation factor GreA n=1 Tax=Lentilactobacillus terminaliae TaxID=3003483 RepID=A0ACD5DE18_9LACO|nr:transcription elongation factor GreA [Lentilactobacillus sp. SPB1-3]MCZ0977539.1 transcription elongation factor GreA [Lentilactobacillus sp. SPB1-3]